MSGPGPGVGIFTITRITDKAKRELGGEFTVTMDGEPIRGVRAFEVSEKGVIFRSYAPMPSPAERATDLERQSSVGGMSEFVYRVPRILVRMFPETTTPIVAPSAETTTSLRAVPLLGNSLADVPAKLRALADRLEPGGDLAQAGALRAIVVVRTPFEPVVLGFGSTATQAFEDLHVGAADLMRVILERKE